MANTLLASYKPIRLEPDGNEIIIEEGEILLIMCEASTPLKFAYPDAHEKSVCTIN